MSVLLLLPETTNAEFDILNGSSRISKQILSSEAELNLTLDHRSSDALINGIPLTINIDLRLVQKRPWLWPSTLLEWQYPVQLGHHPLSGQFTLKNHHRESIRVFHTLGEALQQLDRFAVSEPLPSAIHPGSDLAVQLRAGIDRDALPAPLKLIALFMAPWNQHSEWLEWSVQQ